MLNSSAIVLRRKDFKERDELIAFYTRDFGKMNVIARGTKRIDAKLRGSLDLFDLVRISFVWGANFPILTSAELDKRFRGISLNEHSYKGALEVAGIVCDTFEEGLADKYFFDILRGTIESLDKISSYADARSFYYDAVSKEFQLRALESQGLG